VPNLIHPFVPLAPDQTDILAQRLDGALTQARTLGIRVNSLGRMPQAVKLLKAVYSAGAYPTTHPQLVRTGNAIKAAFQMTRVIDAIQAPGPPGVLRALRRALKGTLDDVGATDAHRAQSELFFGVTLVAGGTRTGAPRPGKGKTPDFVATVDTANYSVEVKRLESVDSIKAGVDEAAEQIWEYKPYPGDIIFDFSDLLPAPFGVKDMATPQATFWGPFRAAYAVAHDYLDARACDPKHARIAVLCCFAESFLWTVPNPHPLPHAALMYYGEVFPRAYGGLVVEQSDKLQARIWAGFQELGGRVRRSVRMP